jgi:hypothetical protein
LTKLDLEKIAAGARGRGGAESVAIIASGRRFSWPSGRGWRRPGAAPGSVPSGRTAPCCPRAPGRATQVLHVGAPCSAGRRRRPGDPVDRAAALGAGLVGPDLAGASRLDREPELLLERAGDGAPDGVVLPAARRARVLPRLPRRWPPQRPRRAWSRRAALPLSRAPLISPQEHEAWDVLLACQGQLRLAERARGRDSISARSSSVLPAATTLPRSRNSCRPPRSGWSRRSVAIELGKTGLDLRVDRPSSSSAAGGTLSGRAEALRSARVRPGSCGRWFPGRAWTCRGPA